MGPKDDRVAELCEFAYKSKEEIEKAGYLFITDEETHSQALVSLEKGALIFAFAGSDSLEDYKFNLDFIRREEGIHPGFREIFLSLHMDIARLIKVNRQADPSLHIIFTGHSSGGAVATLAYSSLYRRLSNCRVVTFGCPRVFGRERNKMQYSIGHKLDEKNIVRYEQPGDPVVKVPPAIFGYSHVGEARRVKLLQPDPEGGNWFVNLFKKLPSRHSMKRYAKNLKGLK